MAALDRFTNSLHTVSSAVGNVTLITVKKHCMFDLMDTTGVVSCV